MIDRQSDMENVGEPIEVDDALSSLLAKVDDLMDNQPEAVTQGVVRGSSWSAPRWSR